MLLKQQTKAKQQRFLLGTQAPLVVRQRDVVSSCLRTSQFFFFNQLSCSYFVCTWYEHVSCNSQLFLHWLTSTTTAEMAKHCKTQRITRNKQQQVTPNSPKKLQARNTSFKTTEEHWPLGGLDLLYQSRGSSPYLKDMGGMLR